MPGVIAALRELRRYGHDRNATPAVSTAILPQRHDGHDGARACKLLAGRRRRTRCPNTAAGTFTVNLVCDVPLGAAAVRDTNLTAIFVAQ